MFTEFKQIFKMHFSFSQTMALVFGGFVVVFCLCKILSLIHGVI